MKAALLARAAELTAAGKTFAVATVVRREAPSSAQLGDTAIITEDGILHGFIGGSCTRATVIDQALEALASTGPRLISFRDDGGGRADDIISVPMTCHSGGSVEVYIEPVFPAPRLVLLGSSPVNQALAGLGAAMGYEVHDRNPDTLAELAGRDRGVKLFVLVATMGESDEDMLEAALPAQPDYLGVIASRRRMEEIAVTLRARGVDEAAIAAIDGPAGLDLGATRPEEIAISVLAKIIASQRGAQPGARDRAEADAGETPATGVEAGVATKTAIDPVCGMAVPADGSKPTAEHDGVTYHFCCTGCRDRFAAEPGAFVDASKPIAADGGETP